MTGNLLSVELDASEVCGLAADNRCVSHGQPPTSGLRQLIKYASDLELKAWPSNNAIPTSHEPMPLLYYYEILVTEH